MTDNMFLMSMKILSTLLAFSNVTAVLYTQPEQVHLSYGGDPTQMVVTWTTFNQTETPTVEFGTRDLDQSQTGFSILFTDGGNESRVLYIHRAVLDGLVPGTAYRYHCGSVDGWSDVFTFNAMKSGSDWSPRFAVFGDLGNENPQSLARLQEEVQKGMYDSILHIGDFAYDMDSDNARVGDQFMRQMESPGCKERHDPFVKNPPPWSAVRISDYGYTRLTVINKTHLTLEQISDDQNGKIVDEITLIKDSHAMRKPKLK